MKARIVQLIARVIALAALGVAGWLSASGEVDPETQQSVVEISSAAAGLVVAFGAVLVDLLIHRAETGGVTKPAGVQNAKKIT